MSYIRITCIEKITTATDEFIHSDAKGEMLVIKQIHLFDSNGKEQRIVRLTKELIETLKQAKIQL